jgi:hypothetical protein
LQLLDVASKRVIATTTYRPALADGRERSQAFEELQWATPKLTAGRSYRIDFANVASDPVANYISVNTLYCQCRDDGPDPDDEGWRSSMTVGPTTFALSPLDSAAGPKWYRPIMALRFDNGTYQGNGYMEVWVSQPRAIGNGARVREHFASLAAPTRFNTLRLRAQVVNAGSLEAVVVVNGEVAAAASATVTPASDPQWITWKLDRPINVEAGVVMSIEFASNDALANAVALRDGQSFGFGASTVVADGYAQADLGSGWLGWSGFHADGNVRYRDGDLALVATWSGS